MSPTRDVGAHLIDRLKVQAENERHYIELLERHAAEGIRVNVGLMAENRQLRERGTQ